jgi:hypothetical protein
MCLMLYYKEEASQYPLDEAMQLWETQFTHLTTKTAKHQFFITEQAGWSNTLLPCVWWVTSLGHDTVYITLHYILRTIVRTLPQIMS